jgi:hypothetical protein
VWEYFVENAKSSTKAQIVSLEILAWLTSAKYDLTWKGTSETFIPYWLTKAQEYDESVDDPKERLVIVKRW